MAQTLVMPHIGESVTQGTVVRWLKAEGDHVDRDEGLVEIETDKVNIEIPSPWSGTLQQILVREGEDVPVGQPLAHIETTEGAVTSEASSPQPPTVTRPPAVAPSPLPSSPRGRGEGEGAISVEEAERRYSPAVLTLAREHGVDLRHVEGTGREGRVTRQDVLAYLAGREAATGAAGAAVPALPRDELQALAPTRRTIAERMVQSARTIPHAWFAVEVDVSALVAWRRQVRDDFRRREGVDLTFLAFAVKAAVGALREHPIVNSSWTDEGILLKKEIGIGIAVATEAGLVVPVIHAEATLSIAGLAKSISELVGRARGRRLTLQDVEGGTFTVNNTGAFGSVLSMPIINYPQAAILTLEAIAPRPVVLNDAIVVRHIANMCLSFDHRVLDGAQAGAFMATVKANMEAYGPETELS